MSHQGRLGCASKPLLLSFLLKLVSVKLEARFPRANRELMPTSPAECPECRTKQEGKDIRPSWFPCHGCGAHLRIAEDWVVRRWWLVLLCYKVDSLFGFYEARRGERC
jgi:hypothetical protein